MTGLPEQQTWRGRVAELLDDPVARAVLRRDGLTDRHVLAELAPIARHLRAMRRNPPRGDGPQGAGARSRPA